MKSEKEIHDFLEEIKNICIKSNRDPSQITIIGASKRQTADSIGRAISCGVINFGENFLQEAEPKIRRLSSAPTWHFIGSIQSKKAKKIASLFQWVHTVDRIRVAEKLNKYRIKSQGKLDICVQINTDNEKNKSGIKIEETKGFINELKVFNMLRIRGLMTIPKPNKNLNNQRKGFKRIFNFFKELKETHPFLDTLSMGMSDDYEAAIMEGANMIRIGTKLFGPRK